MLKDDLSKLINQFFEKFHLNKYHIKKGCVKHINVYQMEFLKETVDAPQSWHESRNLSFDFQMPPFG